MDSISKKKGKYNSSMKKRYQYILFCLLILIVYEVYLVVLYKYKDFQINSYLSYIIAENGKIEESIEQKKERLAYVKTNAFLDKIAKTSQNKKNPGEEVVVLVTDQEVEEYKRIDTNKQMIGGAKQEVSKTLGMTNSEKWIYYIFHIDTRND
ncbi:hypothetical protein CO024_01800 [Candidatus Gracilibacteria bacterium CG_4_9_14_0_2_um_filter_38_7]|nr:MAG: hypothetical protein AUJ87_02195 [Candidatus Gracilibacteria bacterium CG1_02_38_174]PIQ11882.1 MAG: hypothetical protein COW68_01590 [Candidatus Gracilibacteria bacterium CG18_big_fil_WC_8_21_14_2_50_38_16]PJC56676.1 MAG: hypothetical protein CO024_01800 [Candidatus Gracilibacteria bacterium CG_4_9_14_0_2_um_filter_38_7]